MADEFEDMDLSRDPLDVCYIDYLLLLQDLDRHLLPSWNVDRAFHLPERPLPQRLPCFNPHVPIT